MQRRVAYGVPAGIGLAVMLLAVLHVIDRWFMLASVAGELIGVLLRNEFE